VESVVLHALVEEADGCGRSREVTKCWHYKARVILVKSTHALEPQQTMETNFLITSELIATMSTQSQVNKVRLRRVLVKLQATLVWASIVCHAIFKLGIYLDALLLDMMV
jgi:hypothetical protein